MAEQIVPDSSGGLARQDGPSDITPWTAQAGAETGRRPHNSPSRRPRPRPLVADYTVPNRPVTIPLTFNKTIGGTTVPQARANIQAKQVRWMQKGGGWLVDHQLRGRASRRWSTPPRSALTSYAGWESNQLLDIDPPSP